MKPKPDVTERDPQKHMQDFDRQSKEKKDLEQSAEQAEKSTGPDRVQEQEKIRRESGTQK